MGVLYQIQIINFQLCVNEQKVEKIQIESYSVSQDLDFAFQINLKRYDWQILISNSERNSESKKNNHEDAEV